MMHCDRQRRLTPSQQHSISDMLPRSSPVLAEQVTWVFLPECLLLSTLVSCRPVMHATLLCVLVSRYAALGSVCTDMIAPVSPVPV